MKKFFQVATIAIVFTAIVGYSASQLGIVQPLRLPQPAQVTDCSGCNYIDEGKPVLGEPVQVADCGACNYTDDDFRPLSLPPQIAGCDNCG